MKDTTTKTQLPSRAFVLILKLICFAAVSDIAEGADFYISPEGSDLWSGTLPNRNDQNDDGPFATLQRARGAVRELKGKSPGKAITVQIREGIYKLNQTVVFSIEDSGTKGADITYEAYPSETPVISSAISIEGWELAPDSLPHLPAAARGKVWQASLPDGDGAFKKFRTLYDSDGLLPRARSKGFIPQERAVNRRKMGKNTVFCPDGFVRDWENFDDVEIAIRPHHAWILNLLPVESVTVKDQSITTSIPATYAMDELHFLKGTPSCWVENVIEAIDEPGEWVINSREGKIYLWPRDGKQPRGISAPLLQELIRVEGEIDFDGPTDRPVTHLSFKGLTFMHGERYEIIETDKGLQHDWEMHDKNSALLRFRGSEFCVVEDCHFTHSGGGAIRFDLHAQKNLVTGNHIEDIGGTGILFSGYGPGTKDVNCQNTIVNNHIHQVGKVYSHSPGIFLWQSGQNRVAHNLVHHTPYSGIIVSGVMDDFFRKGNLRELINTVRWHEIDSPPGQLSRDEIKPLLHSHDNLVECNEIHHAMEELADGNGIYIRGAGPGNVIRRNYIHHLVAPTLMQSAIRTDGGQRGTLISENIIYKCVSHGIHLKLNNRAENNIIAYILQPTREGKKKPSVYFKLREGPLTGGAVKRNIMYHTRGKATFLDQGNNPRLPAAWAKEADTDYNLYFSKVGPAQAENALQKSREMGSDEHSLATDPLFIDPAAGDFNFHPDSPALRLGFKPIDMTKIGLIESP
ncbi:MAG: right-handed parallel beta-helix repeat-containing protein [Verrucomicrobiales bacterium]|nr:right-handed parallel beta-helix repeat-containing protein [Verrucomicrobiales bacterium]